MFGLRRACFKFPVDTIQIVKLNVSVNWSQRHELRDTCEERQCFPFFLILYH